MSITWIILLSIVLWLALQCIVAKYLILEKEPPKAVSAAAMAEVIFGTLTWAPIGLIADKKLLVAVLLLGLFWIVVAFSLCRGSKIGRTICLVLSILRIPTVIGAFFSLFTLYKLYFTQESKDFFNKKNVTQ